MTLKAYSVHSLFSGPQEVAMLVFAHTVQEAQVVGWREGANDLTDRFIDLAASLMGKHPWLFEEANQEKLAADVPHLIWNIKSCSVCECWGQSRIGEDGLCDRCKEE